MAWVRLSDDFYDHPKFDKAGSLGIALFAAGLAWCNRNLSDGFIPRKAALRLLDFDDAVEAVRNADRNAVTNGGGNDDLTPAIARIVAQRLVDAGLWHEAEGGYQVHDYLEYQGSKVQVEAGRQSNAARQKAWRDRRNAENRNAVTNGPITPAPNPNPNPKRKKHHFVVLLRRRLRRATPPMHERTLSGSADTSLNASRPTAPKGQRSLRRGGTPPG